MVTKEKIQNRLDEIEKENLEKVVIKMRAKNSVRLTRWSKNLTYSSWIKKGLRILPLIKRRLLLRNRDIFLKIHQEVGKDFFLCGSWPAQAVTDSVNMINPTMEGQHALIGYEALGLIKNDIDVYVGDEGESDVETTVLFHSCAYKRLDGFDIDINTINCLNLSHMSLLHGNDLNVTDVAIWVKQVDGQMSIDLVIGGSFWKVILQKKEERRLGPSGIGYHLEAKSFVRLAYKSFQMNIPVDWDRYTCKPGKLAKRHVCKFKEMATLLESPLDKYAVKYIRGVPYLKSTRGFIICSTIECPTRGNKQCPFTLCKSCCRKRSDGSGCKAHK
jgi:hypothetical protein